MPVEERYEAALAAVGDEPPEPTRHPLGFPDAGPGARVKCARRTKNNSRDDGHGAAGNRFGL